MRHKSEDRIEPITNMISSGFQRTKYSAISSRAFGASSLTANKRAKLSFSRPGMHTCNTQRAVSLNTFSLISDVHTQTPRTQTLMGKKVHFVQFISSEAKFQSFRAIYFLRNMSYISGGLTGSDSLSMQTRLQDVYLSFSICDDMGSISFILKQIIITQSCL